MNPNTRASQAPPGDVFDDRRADAPDAAHVSPDGMPTMDSSHILSGHREIAIRHNGRTYRLRCTRLGKLILTA